MLLKFDYKNWRGDDHTYVIELNAKDPFNLTYKGESVRQHPEHAKKGWHISGACISRDGELRDGSPRRSFLLKDMRNVEEVESLT